jgi:uncharacterized glyoxalase superfamily protein PhnB
VSVEEGFPILYVEDVERAAAFYGDALGFEETYRWPLDTGEGYRSLRAGSLSIGLTRIEEARDAPPTISLWMYVDDADAAIERLTRAGARVEEPVADQVWGERMGTVRTPDGHRLALAHKL